MRRRRSLDGIEGKKAQKEAGGRSRRERARQGNVETIIVAVGLAPYLSNERALTRSLSFLALCLIHCDGPWVGWSLASCSCSSLGKRAGPRRRKAGSTFHVLIYSLLLFGAVYINVGRMNLA